VTDIPPDTLELLVLKTLDLGGPMPGYGIAQFIQATSEDVLRVAPHMLYRILQRMLKRGLIASGRTGASVDTGRGYRITAAGKARLEQAEPEFHLLASAVIRVLEAGEAGFPCSDKMG
jgi:DNA-binding PadR family transcriptional regulator